MNGAFNRFLARFVRIEPGETRAVLTAFLLLFCVLGGYFAVRPVRETVGTILGEAITSDTWIWTAVFAILIVPVYGWLVARVSRARADARHLRHRGAGAGLHRRGDARRPAPTWSWAASSTSASASSTCCWCRCSGASCWSCSSASRPSGCSASSPPVAPRARWSARSSPSASSSTSAFPASCSSAPRCSWSPSSASAR